MRKIISTVVLCIVVASAHAKTTAWIGGSGSFSNEASWNNGLPAAGDTVVISNTTESAISVQNDLENMAFASVTIDGTDSLTLWGNPLTVTSSITLRSTDAVVSNDVTSTRGNGTFVMAYKKCSFYGTMTHTTGDSDIYSHKNGTGSITFYGPVDCSGRKVTFYSKPSYPITFKNTLKASSTTGIYQTGYKGNIYFDAPGNEITTMTAVYSSYQLRGENVLPSDATLSFTAKEDTGHFYLNGFNQTISRISSGGSGSGKANCINSSAPAVLTLKAQASATTAACVCDNITIVYDAQDDYVQTFKNRKHLTKGDIIVKNGTVKMDGTNYFASVPAVTLESGAKFDVATTNSGALASVATLVLDSNARFSVAPTAVDIFGTTATRANVRASSRFVLPDGAVLRVGSLYVDGVPVAVGEYSQTADETRQALQQVEGAGTLVVDSVPAGTYWTGANGTDWDDAGNWTAGVPAAGVAAHIEKFGTVSVNLSSASAASAGGLIISNQDGETTLVVGSDLSLSGGEMRIGQGATMTVCTNVTVVWDGTGVASGNSAEAVSIRDGGVVNVEGGTLHFTNTTGRVAIGGDSDASTGTLFIKGGVCDVYRKSGNGLSYLKGGLLKMIGGYFAYDHVPVMTGGEIDCSGDAQILADFQLYGNFFRTGSMRLTGNSKMFWKYVKAKYGNSLCRFYFTPNNSGETTLVEVLDSADFDFGSGDYVYIGNGTAGGTSILRADTTGKISFGNSGCIGMDDGVAEFVLSNGVAKANSYSFFLGSISSNSKIGSPSGTMRMYGGSFSIGNRSINTHIDGFLLGDGQKCGANYSKCHPKGLLELHDGTMNIQSWLTAGIGGGTGTIHQCGGTLKMTHASRPMVLGLKGGTGFYEMTGGMCTNKADVYVGGCFTNILNVLEPTLRDALPGYGTLSVSGGTFSTAKDIYVGLDGHGAFNVGTGGVVTAANLHITNSYDSVLGETVAGALSFTLGPSSVGRIDLSGALKVAPGATLSVDVSACTARKSFQLLNCASMEREFAPENVTIVADHPAIWGVEQSGTGLRLTCAAGTVLLFR